MQRAKLWASPPVKIPRGLEESTVLATQLVQIGTEEYLEIDVFEDERRVLRYFAEHTETTDTWWHREEGGDWKQTRLEGWIVNRDPIHRSLWNTNVDQMYATKEDQARVREYLEAYSLNSWEQTIGGKKYIRAMNRKADRINAMMDCMDPLEAGVDDWLDLVIFPGHFLIKKDAETCVCTACGDETKSRAKHGMMLECPTCGTMCRVEKRLEEKKATENIIVLQPFRDAHGTKWAERQFVAHCRWAEGEKTITMYEKIRAIMPAGRQWGSLFYGQYHNADEFSQEWWTSNTCSQTFRKSYLYPHKLDAVLPIGGLERSGIRELAEHGEKFDVNKWILECQSRPYLEYMAKAGMVKLAHEVMEQTWLGNPKPGLIDPKGRRMKDVLRIDGNRLNRLKELGGGATTLRWLQHEQQSGTRIKTENLHYLEKKKIYPDHCTDLLRVCGSANKITNYLRKQKIKAADVIQFWTDYLRMAEAEGMNTEDDIVRFPKELQRRHDELTERRNQREQAEKDARNAAAYAELNSRIEKHLPEVRGLFWENDTYMIVPAGTCQELVAEGRALHHCVGASKNYMEKMASGATWILFLRKKENLDTPYYTLEVDLKTFEMRQWYSEYDRKPDREIIEPLISSYVKRLRRQAA